MESKMSQIAEATTTAAKSPEATQALPAIGSAFGGGYFAGQIRVGDVLFGLVMAGAAGELSGRWNAGTSKVEDAVSRRDGRENTIAMDAAGSKLAARALALNINGFTDWYIPALDELEILYRNFKPSSCSSYPGDGINKNSVPAGTKYTSASPAQTTVAALVEDEADALIPAWYWSSTQFAADPANAWFQGFVNGYQNGNHKSYAGRARAVRRFVIQ
jgi:hypothetical protein